MIFQCDDLDRALRSPELLPDARAHADHCPQCSQQLHLWDEISRLAPGLHEEWESPALWPSIQRELAAVAPVRAIRRPPVWQWMLAAAAVFGLAAILLQPWRSAQPKGSDFLTEETLRDVERAETAYAKSIEKLSAVTEPRLEQSSSPLAAVYREKLALLDSAIAEIKTNLETNRYNMYLQNQLASLYREKQKTLKDWLENAKSN